MRNDGCQDDHLNVSERSNRGSQRGITDNAEPSVVEGPHEEAIVCGGGKMPRGARARCAASKRRRGAEGKAPEMYQQSGR